MIIKHNLDSQSTLQVVRVLQEHLVSSSCILATASISNDSNIHPPPLAHVSLCTSHPPELLRSNTRHTFYFLLFLFVVNVHLLMSHVSQSSHTHSSFRLSFQVHSTGPGKRAALHVSDTHLFLHTWSRWTIMTSAGARRHVRHEGQESNKDPNQDCKPDNQSMNASQSFPKPTVQKHPEHSRCRHTSWNVKFEMSPHENECAHSLINPLQWDTDVAALIGLCCVRQRPLWGRLR